MDFFFVVVCAVFALVTGEQCDPSSSEHELILSLNKKILSSVEDQSDLPNPSLHLALRLSAYHNHAIENSSLQKLNTKLYSQLESSLTKGQPVTGLLALYILALKASCYDLSTVTLNHDSLIHQLKKQVEQEKEHITVTRRPLTNYYQYSLGILAQCVSGVRVSLHVRNKLVQAVKHGNVKHGENQDIDTLAMAGMALQCVKKSDCGHDDPELVEALHTVKQKLQDSQRPDGHMGNEFSTGLAVQALLAMGSELSKCSASMEALRTSARNGIYHNPMAISQMLPALQKRSYLQVKEQQCNNEDDSLVLEETSPTVPLNVENVALRVEVTDSDGYSMVKDFEVPKGSSLLEALTLLQQKQEGFTFQTESSLWGPFLSEVNGIRARQSDRSYWHLSSDGIPLNEGIGDYKILKFQKITIKKTNY